MFVDFNILNQLGSPAINSNTFANRPAAGQTGRLFVSTDTFELYRDNGTGWDLIGGPGSSTVTGSGAAGQVTYWTGASTIGGNNNLFWDSTNFRLGIGTATPGTKLDVHTTTGAALQLNSTNAVGNIYSDYQNQGTTQYRVGYTDDADINYRRFGIYDSIGAKETITIDQQSRYVGINYQYSSLADQPAYTLDVSGSTRVTDSSFFVTSGTGQVGINTTSPTQATALIEAVKTDGYGLFLNYATASGSGSTATALWALNTTAGSGYAAVIEEKTANTTGGQYPLLIKHSLSTGTAAAGIGTGLHFQLPDSTGTFKTTQLTVETTDAAAATYTTRYRFMAQVNGTSTALAYLTSVGLGIGNVIPSYKLDVNGTVRAFGAGNTGNYLAVDTNVGGATVQLNPQYGTGLPILQSVGAFPLLFGTNNTEVARFFTNGNFLIGTSGTDSGYKLDVSGTARFTNSITANSTSGISGTFTSSNFFGSIDLENTGGTATGKWNVQAVSGAQVGGSAGSSFGIYSYGASAYRLFINSSGSVGIGTSTPAAKFQISAGYGLVNNAYSWAVYNQAANAFAAQFGAAGDVAFGTFGDNAIVAAIGSNAILFGTNSTERARITSGGNFLIGTTTDGGAKLQVNGNFNLGNGSFYANTNSKISVGTINQIGQIDATNANGAKSINNTKQKGTSDATFNLLTLSNAATNFGVGIYGRIVAVSPISNDAVIIEFWAAANRSGGGATTYTALTPVISKTIVGSSISAGTLAWSGATLQYTTSTLVNYTYFNFEIQAGMGDSGTITFN